MEIWDKKEVENWRWGVVVGREVKKERKDVNFILIHKACWIPEREREKGSGGKVKPRKEWCLCQKTVSQVVGDGFSLE